MFSIIRSPSLFVYFNHFLTAQGSDLHFSLENVVPITDEQIIICSKTPLDGTKHEQTSICRQLFAGHVEGSRPMERKKMHRMIIHIINPVDKTTVSFKIWPSENLSSF